MVRRIDYIVISEMRKNYLQKLRCDTKEELVLVFADFSVNRRDCLFV